MKSCSNVPRGFFRLAVSLVVLALLASGCALVNQRSERMRQYAADIRALEQGDQAFGKGDYQKAGEIYQKLSQHTQNEFISYKALYGLACARLILAESQNEVNEAMMLWNIWDQLVPKNKEVGDPRMLTPFLKHAAGSLSAEPGKGNAIPVKEEDYRKLLTAKDKEIDRLQAKLGGMEKEVQTLKHQIESLEAIHQTIQEKKKELSPP